MGIKLLRVTPEQAAAHYEEHEGKPFYPGLVEFITSGPTVAMVLEGPGAVATVRTMMGATDPLNSAPGTIRGDLALELGENVVHGSDSVGVGRTRDLDLLQRRPNWCDVDRRSARAGADRHWPPVRLRGG